MSERIHNHGGPCSLCEEREAELERLREMERQLKEAVREAYAALKQIFDEAVL